MRTIKVIIHGIVQGVSFRSSTKKTAELLGLSGYAKNLSDGSVEVLAQGKDDKILKLIEFLKKGPIGAKVDKIEIKEVLKEFKTL